MIVKLSKELGKAPIIKYTTISTILNRGIRLEDR